MKRLALLLIVAAGAGPTASTLWAEEGQPAPGQPASGQPDKVVVERRLAVWGAAEGGQRQAVSPYAYMLKDIPLTEEQIKKINELWEAQQAAMKEWQAANADKVKALQGALAEASKNKDQDAQKKLWKEFNDLYAGQRELYQKTHEQVMAVLTPEQRAQLQQNQAIQSAVGWLWGVKLNEEQMGKVKAAYGEIFADVKAEDRKAYGEAIKKLRDKVEKDILTDEQRAPMKEAQQKAQERMKAYLTTAPAADGPRRLGVVVDAKSGEGTVIINEGAGAGGEGGWIIINEKAGDAKEKQNPAEPAK